MSYAYNTPAGHYLVFFLRAIFDVISFISEQRVCVFPSYLQCHSSVVLRICRSYWTPRRRASLDLFPPDRGGDDLQRYGTKPLIVVVGRKSLHRKQVVHLFFVISENKDSNAATICLPRPRHLLIYSFFIIISPVSSLVFRDPRPMSRPQGTDPLLFPFLPAWRHGRLGFVLGTNFALRLSNREVLWSRGSKWLSLICDGSWQAPLRPRRLTLSNNMQ